MDDDGGVGVKLCIQSTSCPLRGCSFCAGRLWVPIGVCWFSRTPVSAGPHWTPNFSLIKSQPFLGLGCSWQGLYNSYEWESSPCVPYSYSSSESIEQALWRTYSMCHLRNSEVFCVRIQKEETQYLDICNKVILSHHLFISLHNGRQGKETLFVVAAEEERSLHLR